MNTKNTKTICNARTMGRADVLGGAGGLTALAALATLAGGCAKEPGPMEPVDAGPAEPVDAGSEDAGPVDAAPAEPEDARPADAGPRDFAVRGWATGVLGPVALALRAGDDVEHLTVMQDGPFAFETRIEEGSTYAVTLANPALPCMLHGQSGVISDADTAIELTCTGASLASVAVSGIAPAVTLVPGTTEYAVDLPLLQGAVTVTATAATPGDTVRIAGTPVASGEPSAPIALGPGDNPVDIVVENPVGWQQTYRLILRRASQLALHAYGKASNTGVGDELGFSVALSGDTLAVGAPNEASASQGVDGDQADDGAPESGAVYVFRRAGASWHQEAYLKASNAGAGDYFGISVALSGDTLAVGAHGEASASQGADGDQADDSAENSGAVYVFRRTGTSWQQEAYLKASNTGAGDELGISVALAGDTLAAGARGEDSAATGIDGDQWDGNEPGSGAVYVFRRSGTRWQQEAYLKASNTGTGDELGTSVALAGDTLAAGAWGEASAATGIDGDQDDDSAPRSGAVYVFRRTGTGWQQEAYLKASNTDAGDELGTSVTLSGEALAVGAQGEDSASQGEDGDQRDDSAPASGAVYVFRRAGTSWDQEAYVKASNSSAYAGFGASVSLAGDALAVGAPGHGAIYVSGRAGTAWQQRAYLETPGSGAGDFFGWSVALSGDTLAVGARWEDSAATGINGDQDSNAAWNSGSVYVFR
jgi:hypothetical protein